MGKVRFTGGQCVLRHPDHGEYARPDASVYYDDTDPLVKAHRWAFSTDEEIAATQEAGPVVSAPIERATRAPGEKRTTRRLK